MSGRYFVNCSEMGFETYATEKEAKEAAEKKGIYVDSLCGMVCDYRLKDVN